MMGRQQDDGTAGGGASAATTLPPSPSSFSVWYEATMHWEAPFAETVHLDRVPTDMEESLLSLKWWC